MLQHNEATNIQSKPSFVPRGHHLLFTFLLVCFLACSLAMPIMLICFMPFRMLFASFPSIACLLVSCLCLCMYTHKVRMHRVRARSSRCKQKGHRCKLVDISQAACSVVLEGLASPFWLCTLSNPLPSSLLSLLDGLY